MLYDENQKNSHKFLKFAVLILVFTSFKNIDSIQNNFLKSEYTAIQQSIRCHFNFFRFCFKHFYYSCAIVYNILNIGLISSRQSKVTVNFENIVPII